MKLLAIIERGCGAILPVILVVSIGFDLYDRFKERHQKLAPSDSDSNE